jgi:hypothetical protein
MAKPFSSFLSIGALVAGFMMIAGSAPASTTPELSARPNATYVQFSLEASRTNASGGVQLAFGCDAGQCSCHGDTDCNNMYSGGACKTNGSCETAGGVTCTCATHAMVHSPTTGIIKKPPFSILNRSHSN